MGQAVRFQMYFSYVKNCLNHNFLFSLAHGLEGFDRNFEHGVVRLARGQGL
jgi:hypothetical protein